MTIPLKNVSNYILGIMFGIGSIAEGRIIFRHKDRYFLEQIQIACGNTMYKQEKKGKPQYVLKTREFDIDELKQYGWEERNAEQRNIPTMDDYSDFLRAYIELHGSFDYSTRYMRKDKKEKYKGLRLRIYGNYIIINSINNILHRYVKVNSKTPQLNMNGKTATLYYTSFKEIDTIVNYISGTPCFEELWEDVDAKLRKPVIYKDPLKKILKNF